jgi:hypothetical protein
MKKMLGILNIVSLVILLTACLEQTENRDAEPAPLEGLFSGTELSYNEYRFILEDVVDRAEDMNLDDDLLKKWVIRALGDEKLMNKRDLTKEEAVEKAEYNYQYHKAWIAVAEDTYGITVTEEEVDAWIKEGPDQSDIPQHKAYADSLGLTLEELNHEYDRDLYTQSVMMDTLLPLLKEAYGTSDSGEIAEMYDGEVKKKMKETAKRTA